MARKAIIATLILNCVFVHFTQAQIDKKEHTIQPGDPEYGTIYRVVESFDNNVVIKTDLFFTEKYTKENGRISQSEIFENKNPIAYEILFSAEYTKVWGITKTIERLKKDGRHESIEYVFYNGQTRIFKNNSLEIITRFQPRLIQSLVSVGEFKKSDDPNNPIYNLDLRGVSGSTLVTEIPNDAHPIHANERNFIQKWLLSTRSNDISKLYNYKIVVNENGRPVVLMVQDDLLKSLLTKKSTVVYYYHLGALNDAPINILVGFYEYGS